MNYSGDVIVKRPDVYYAKGKYTWQLQIKEIRELNWICFS